MSALELVDAMKAKTRAEARAKALLVAPFDDVFLVPVGPWILEESWLVALLTDWRSRASQSFFAQFDPSPQSMKSYLGERSLVQGESLLFLIQRGQTGAYLGHMGLKNLMRTCAEVDAVMRNPDVSTTGLMSGGLRRMMNWAVETLPLKAFELKVRSDNGAALHLYRRLGFVVVERYSLRRVDNEEGIVHVPCEIDEANVSFEMLVMRNSSGVWNAP